LPSTTKIKFDLHEQELVFVKLMVPVLSGTREHFKHYPFNRIEVLLSHSQPPFPFGIKECRHRQVYNSIFSTKGGKQAHIFYMDFQM